MKVIIDNGKTFAKLNELTLWDKNPRNINEKDYKRLKYQIKKLGQFKPLLITTAGMVIGGNMRLRAYREMQNELNVDKVWVSVVEPKNENELLEYALSDNDRAGYYNDEDLANLMPNYEIDWAQYAVDLTQPVDLDTLQKDYTVNTGGGGDRTKLTQNFIIPPFSVFDTRQGYWQDRKSEWVKQIGAEELADTKENVLGADHKPTMLSKINSGSSLFDPVLAEIVYRWFNVPQGKILDPFAGEQSKGFVAGILGYKYTGIEIRPEQVAADKASTAEFIGINYITGDSSKLNELVLENDYDLIFTSPPYYDLEIYSDNAGDASGFGTYAQFMEFYKTVFSQAVSHLKDDRFLVVKVGEIRDKKTGVYRNFVADNIRVMTECGLQYYNDIILVNAAGTAPLRARNSMRNRKIIKLHQNILVFYKGNLANIQTNYPVIDFDVVDLNQNYEEAEQET
jgi:DNA modification methylase